MSSCTGGFGATSARSKSSGSYSSNSSTGVCTLLLSTHLKCDAFWVIVPLVPCMRSVAVIIVPFTFLMEGGTVLYAADNLLTFHCHTTAVPLTWSWVTDFTALHQHNTFVSLSRRLSSATSTGSSGKSTLMSVRNNNLARGLPVVTCGIALKLRRNLYSCCCHNFPSAVAALIDHWLRKVVSLGISSWP